MTAPTPYRLTAEFTLRIKDFTGNTVAGREVRTVCIGILEWILKCPTTNVEEIMNIYRVFTHILGTRNQDQLYKALPPTGDNWETLLGAVVTCEEVTFDAKIKEDCTDLVIILRSKGNPDVTIRLCFRRPGQYANDGNEVESVLECIEFCGEAVFP